MLLLCCIFSKNVTMMKQFLNDYDYDDGDWDGDDSDGDDDDGDDDDGDGEKVLRGGTMWSKLMTCPLTGGRVSQLEMKMGP